MPPAGIEPATYDLMFINLTPWAKNTERYSHRCISFTRVKRATRAEREATSVPRPISLLWGSAVALPTSRGAARC